MYPEFRYLKTDIVGISTDSLSEAASLEKMAGTQFKLLSDPDGKVISDYGVFNLLGDGVAAPAVFIIGHGRLLEWSYVGNHIGDRPRAKDILFRLMN